MGATGCEPVGIVAGATTAVEDCGTRTSKGAISCGLTYRRLRLANVPRYEFLIVVQRRKHGLRRYLGCRSFLRLEASTNAMGSANGPRGRQRCRRGDEEGGRRGHGEPHRERGERTPHARMRRGHPMDDEMGWRNDGTATRKVKTTVPPPPCMGTNFRHLRIASILTCYVPASSSGSRRARRPSSR